MKIGIIGAGKVGFTLGKFFSQGGVRVTGYYSRDPDSAREAAAFTQSSFYGSLQPLIEDSDAIFITVPDKAITAVYEQVRRFEITNKYICHCSGALSAAEAFPAIGETGAHGFSIHPLFPVSSKYDAYRELTDAFFALRAKRPICPPFRYCPKGWAAARRSSAQNTRSAITRPARWRVIWSAPLCSKALTCWSPAAFRPSWPPRRSRPSSAATSITCSRTAYRPR